MVMWVRWLKQHNLYTKWCNSTRRYVIWIFPMNEPVEQVFNAQARAAATTRDGLLHADVATRLREMILTGELAAGTRLNERVLCESLQVSRTPLREAFRVLAAERLVMLHPNRGASVVALSIQDIRDVVEVMIGLECLPGELAALRASDAQIDEIRSL